MNNNEEIGKKIRGILLLHKTQNVTPHLLGALGLTAFDFGVESAKETAAILDESECPMQIRVVTPGFGQDTPCTCAKSRLDKTVAIPGQANKHTSDCLLSLKHKLNTHPNLKTFGRTESGKARYQFELPYHFSNSANGILRSYFPELENPLLMGNFEKAWRQIMDIAGVKPPVEETGAPGESGAELANVSDDLDDLFGGAELEARTATAQEQPVEVAQEDLAENVPPEPTNISDLVPPTPTPAPKGKKGKKTEDHFGSGAPSEPKKDKQEEGEKKKDGKEKEDKTGKVYRSLTLLANNLEEECSRFMSIAKGFREKMEAFPKESVRSLKCSLDRLAKQAAQTEYKGEHERENEKSINPVVEITQVNVVSVVRAACRDLELAMEKPKAWEEFSKTLAEVVKKTKSMEEILDQHGIADAVQEPPRLKDEQGNSLTT